MKRLRVTLIVLFCLSVATGGFCLIYFGEDPPTSVARHSALSSSPISPVQGEASNSVIDPRGQQEVIARGDGVVWGRIAADDSGSDPSTLRVQCVGHGFAGTQAFPERVPDEKGRFSCNGLPWGRYTVKATSEHGVAYQTLALSAAEPVREVHLSLTRAAPLAGVVLDGSRSPIEDAQVLVREWQPVAGGADSYPVDGADYLSARSDGQGGFRIEGVPMGPSDSRRSYRLLVTADGYPATPSAYYLPGTEDIEIILGAGGHAEGTVLLEDTGEPVGGITIQTQVAGSTLEVLSDDQGRFQFSPLAAGSYEALVLDAEWVSTEPRYPFTVVEGQSAQVPPIRITEGARIAGTVTDLRGGNGVARATLQLSAMDGTPGESRTSREVTSGEDGSYVITGLRGGTYRVRVSSPPGYLVPAPQKENGQQAIAVLVGGRQESVNFSLVRGSVVNGRVHDLAGAAIPGAEVTAIAEASEALTMTETDGDGTFTLTVPGDDQRIEVFAQKPGYLGEPVFLDGDTLATSPDIELVLSPASAIAGTVVNSLGAACSGAAVLLAAVEADGLTNIRTVTTERDGTFEYDFLEPGEYVLRAGPRDTSAELAPEEQGELRVTLAAGELKQELRLLLGEEGESISGRVTDGDGNPFQYAAISVWVGPGKPLAGYAHSDEDGFYTVPGLAAGEYFMAAQAPKVSADRKRGVAAGSTGIDFVMVEPGVIAGQVLDASTREPVTAFSFAICHADEPRIVQHLKFRQVQNPDGRFRVEGASVGENTIFLRAPDHMDGEFTVSQVMSGQTTAEQVFTLEPGLIIQGTVTSPDGEGLAGVRMLADMGTSPYHNFRVSQARTVTDRNGNFVIRKLEDATYTVVAIHPDFASARIQAQPASNKSVHIVLGNGGVVEGVVTVGGEPQIGASVSLTTEDQVSKSTHTDERGEFRLAGALPGAGLVRVQVGVHPSPEYRKQERNVEVREGQITELHVDFPKASVRLEGTVYGLDGNPIAADVILRVYTEDGMERMGHASGDDGFYLFDGVPPGEAELTVSFTGLIQRRVTVSIPEGAQVTQDIFLDSGYSIRCNVQPPSEPYEQIRLMAVPGEHFLSRADSDILNALLAAAISMGESYAGGPVVLSGLVPGEYTVVAWVNTTAYREAEDPTERARLKLERPIHVVPLVLSGDNANPEIQIEF